MSQPYDIKGRGPDFYASGRVLRHCGSPVETRCKRGREHTAIPYMCNLFSSPFQRGLFVFVFKAFAQCTKASKGLGIIVRHRGDAGFGKNRH